MYNEEYEEIDHSTDEDLHQIEVSHGSTSNQTSIYASDVSRPVVCCTFCCDIFLLLTAIVFLVFTLLVCLNVVPHTKQYLHDHPEGKTSIAVAGAFATSIFFVIFVIRCCRKCQCQRRSLAIWFRCKRRIPSDAHTFDNEEEVDNVGANASQSPRKSIVGGELKLTEINEEELQKIQKILTSFINYHEDFDWTFSACSSGLFSKKQTPKKNDVRRFSNVKMKISVKVVLVGSTNVGKTSIFHRILYNRFTEYYMATLGADLGHTTLHLFPQDIYKHLEISVQLWDIAGSERFSDLAHIVYRDTTSFVVVCDATSSHSTSILSSWVKDIKESVHDPHISLFYNKIDLMQHVTMPLSDEETDKYQKYSVSAKTGESVLKNLAKVIVQSTLHEISKLL